jgi:hypothetical protein
MNRTPVKSSHLKSVGHDPQSNTLEVEFINGKVYTYQGVQASTHRQITKHSSPGGMFHKLMRQSKPNSTPTK